MISLVSLLSVGVSTFPSLDDRSSIRIPLRHYTCNTDVLTICEGIVFLKSRNDYAVWNPFLNRHRRVLMLVHCLTRGVKYWYDLGMNEEGVKIIVVVDPILKGDKTTKVHLCHVNDNARWELLELPFLFDSQHMIGEYSRGCIYWVGAGNLMEYVVRFNICKREFEVIRLPFKASSYHIPSGGFAFPTPLLQVLNGDVCTFKDKGDAIVIWSLSKAKR